MIGKLKGIVDAFGDDFVHLDVGGVVYEAFCSSKTMQSLPQVLINVEVDDKATVADAPSVRTAVAEAEAELGGTGRILLRPSGTEQMVRVMVEAADEDTARQLAIRVAESVSEHR